MTLLSTPGADLAQPLLFIHYIVALLHVLAIGFRILRFRTWVVYLSSWLNLPSRQCHIHPEVGLGGTIGRMMYLSGGTP